MRKALLITYSFLCLIGILLLMVFIPAYTPEYLGYGIPSSTLPNLLAFCITLFSGIELFKTLKKQDDGTPAPFQRSQILFLTTSCIVFFLTFPLMEIIGFLPGALLSLTCIQLVCGQRNFIQLALISVITSVAIYSVASYVLNIPLP